MKAWLNTITDLVKTNNTPAPDKSLHGLQGPRTSHLHAFVCLTIVIHKVSLIIQNSTEMLKYAQIRVAWTESWGVQLLKFKTHCLWHTFSRKAVYEFKYTLPVNHKRRLGEFVQLNSLSQSSFILSMSNNSEENKVPEAENSLAFQPPIHPPPHPRGCISFVTICFCVCLKLQS